MLRLPPNFRLRFSTVIAAVTASVVSSLISFLRWGVGSCYGSKQVKAATKPLFSPSAFWPLKKLKNRYFSPRINLVKLHTVGIVLLMVGVIVGSYLTISELLLPRIRALSETTFEMPADMAFNREEAGELAGWEDGEGTSFALANEVRLATAHSWWNPEFLYKKPLTIKNLSAITLASDGATTAQITLNTKELYDAGKLQDNCNDLRIIRVATDSEMRLELPRSIQLAAGATNCADSTGTIVSFPLERQLESGGEDNGYEVYYGSEGAGGPLFPREIAARGTSSVSFTAPDSDALSFADQDFTLSFWMKFTQPLGWVRIGKFHTSNFDMSVEYSFQIDDSGRFYLRFNNSGSGQIYGGFDADTSKNQWHHFSIVHDSSEDTIKIVQNFDRVLLDASMSFTITPTDYNFLVHNLGVGNYVDNIQIWNQALNQEEILERAVYESNTTDPYWGNLVGYWKFDELSGVTIKDSSTTGLDGTLSSSTLWSTDSPNLATSVGKGLRQTATLVCPLNGTTTCAGGETPSTETGTIRYSGGKSALEFDGIDDRVQVMTDLSQRDQVTMETWFYFPDSWETDGIDQYHAILGWSGDFNLAYRSGVGNAHFFGLYGHDGSSAKSSFWQPGSNYPKGWHHLAAVWDGSEARFYFDGVLKSTTLDFTAIHNSVTQFRIAEKPSGGPAYWRAVDSVHLTYSAKYTDDFTPTNKLTADDDSVFLFYFDENGSDPRQSGVAIDASGNGNHGTITGAKYVSGLTGVDSTLSSVALETLATPTGSYASHQGIFLEEGTTNYIRNPSFEINSERWACYGSPNCSLSTSSNYSKFGGQSLYVQSTEISSIRHAGRELLSSGFYGVSPGNNYCFSGYLRAEQGAARLYVRWLPVEGAITNHYSPWVSTNSWERVEICGLVPIDANSTDVLIQTEAGSSAIYADGLQFEVKARPTTYTDGSLGSGYAWSGDAHNAPSTRAASSLFYPNQGTINSSSGTVSLWFKPRLDFGFSQAGTDVLFASNGTFNSPSSVNIYIDSGRNLIFSLRNDANTIFGVSAGATSADILDANQWYQLVMTWDGQKLRAYVNNQLYGEIDYDGAVTLDSNNFSIGPTQGRPARGTLSDLRIFNNALTDERVSELFHAGFLTHANSTEANDRYQASGSYTSPTIDLSANGQWGEQPLTMSQTLNGGSINYFTRTSQNNSSWSEWQSVGGSVENGASQLSIASPPHRYLQFKAELTAPATRAESPVITGMTTTYVQDFLAPKNPTAAALGFSYPDLADPDLTAETWYNYATPKFTWEAGEDVAELGQSASGIDAYHLLLTKNPAAIPTDSTGDSCYRLAPEGDRVFLPGSKPTGCALTDGIYYLRIQAKDNAGNVAEPATLFIYHYDGSIPMAPSSISTTNVGYQAENTFTFFWPTAADQGPSGVAGYEYKTGASAGPFSEWQFTTATSVVGIEAYQEGQNFFYVRTVDEAGNYSGETSNNVAAGSFYFNSTAPTAPLNLSVTPHSTAESPATSNVFTVEWDKPASYSGEVAKYFYCVNCTPSANTMTQTDAAETVERKLTNFALATQQGKNTFYLVAEDNNVNTAVGHGNRNFEAFASIDFYASTVAPAAPGNLNVSDASNRDKQTWRLTLAWEEPDSGGTPAQYEIFRSTDAGATYTRVGDTTSTAFTDASLEQSKTYFYKIRAIDNAGSVSIFSNVVSLSPEGKYTSPPSAGGVPVVDEGSTTATIHWSTARDAYGTVEYGKTSSYGSAVSSTTPTANHAIKITGLTPGETYHFRVQSLDDPALVGYMRSDAYSADYSFTTLSAPAISNVEVTDISLDAAVVSWKSSSLQTAKVEYGPTDSYGSEVTVSVTGDESVHTARLPNLEHSAAYHFRIRATDVDGNDIVSDDYVFETVTFPEVTAVLFNTDQGGQGTSATIAWSTNVPTTGQVDYQPLLIDIGAVRNPNLVVETQSGRDLNMTAIQALSQAELAALPVIPNGELQSVYAGDMQQRRIQRITGLQDGSLYVFTIRGRDQYGNEAISEPIRYVTGADTRPPEISNIIIETPIIGIGADSRAQIILSFETDEPAHTQVHWGRGTGSEYPESSELSREPTTQHVVVVRDLDPTSTFHLKIAAADISGNVSETEDIVVVTPTAQEAAFDIILRNLEGIFGFLGS